MLIHMASPAPLQCENLQNARYEIKSGFSGPRIILSNNISGKINQTVPHVTITIAERMRCHLNASRWSRKPISFSGALIYFFRGVKVKQKAPRTIGALFLKDKKNL